MVSTIDQEGRIKPIHLARQIDSGESARLPAKPRAVRVNIDLHFCAFSKCDF
ncbi:hypothetical protein G8D25_04030 (plasmid) [Ralstonia solanacearum]|nr:hypothetical protein G8D25_04030 [Ralstonia solanacearum]